MNRKLKVGLYGQCGHQIQGKLYNNPEAELTAVCAMSDELIAEIQNRCGRDIKLYGTLEEMLRDESIELISLCSPKRCDQEADAIACLRAGKHVYAEKPAVFSEEGIARVFAVANETGYEFHEMADSVFMEPYWSARKLVRSGKLGEIVQVYVQKSYPLNIHRRPQDEETDGGLIRQAGIHAIRFLEHITDLTVEHVEVRQTHLGNVKENEGLFTASSWMMTLENGGVASACINYLNPKGFPRRGNECVRIWGTEGMLEIVDGATHTHIYTQTEDDGEIDISKSDCKDFFQELVHHLLYGKEMPLTQEEELHPLRVVIRAFEAAEVTK